MKKKTIALCLVIAVLLAGLLCKDHLIRAYVSLSHEKLEGYAVQALEDSAQQTEGRYGLWSTFCAPSQGMVEFTTGGWGLAPGSTYKGFYYSADDTHKLFSAAYPDTASMEIDGDHAFWTDGTDNHGTSSRILAHWFWFEASF